MTRPPPRSTLFPYTTLFRSDQGAADVVWCAAGDVQLRSGAQVRSAKRTEGQRGVRGGAVAREATGVASVRSEEHTSELQSQFHLVCRLLLEKKKKTTSENYTQTTQTQKKYAIRHVTTHMHQSKPLFTTSNDRRCNTLHHYSTLTKVAQAQTC